MGKNAVIILSVASCVLYWGGALAAESGPGTSTGPSGLAIAGPQISALPPMFDASVSQNLGAQMLNCFNVGAALNAIGDIATTGPGTGVGDNVNNTLSNVGANIGGMPFAQGGGCGPDEIASSSMSCPLSATAKQVETLMEQKDKQFQQVMKAISCKKNKFDAVQTQLSCLTSQAQGLQAQIGTLQQAFQDNIQRMQTDVAQIKAIETDREAQLEDVTKRLGGDKDNGAEGLLALRDRTAAAVNTKMPQQILSLKESFKQVELARKSLAESVETRTMGQTTDCFNNSSGQGYRCSPNGPPVTIREYVLCRYEQNRQLGDSGRIEQNQVVKNQAAASRAGLESLINSIFGHSAKMTVGDPKSPPSQNNPVMNYVGTISNPEMIEAQFGSRLGAYNGKGLDIRDFVMKSIRSCFSESQKIVQRERLNKSSSIGQQTESFNAAERKTKSEVGSFIEEHSQLFTQNMAVLTGQHLPLNTSACVNGSPEVQMGCLDDLKRNMSGLLMGNVPNSTMNTVVRGTNEWNNIQISCQGLQGCVTAFQNTSTNLTREVKRLRQFKSDYVLRANQNVENFTKQMAQRLSGQSGMLQQKMQALGQTLAGLGVSPLNVNGVQVESLEKDADGLPMTPKNVLGLVGSQMNPPMPDFQSDSFSDGIRNIAEGRARLDEKVARVMQAKAEMESSGKECIARLQEKSSEGLQKALSKFQDCVQVRQHCEYWTNNGVTSITSLINSMGNLNLADYDVDGTVLESGIQECKSKLQKVKNPEQCELLWPDPLESVFTKNGEFDKVGFHNGKLKAQKAREDCIKGSNDGIFTNKTTSCPDVNAINSAKKKFERNVTGADLEFGAGSARD